MRRRRFIAGLGALAPAVMSSARAGGDGGGNGDGGDGSGTAPRPYPKPARLTDLPDDLGRVAVYLRLVGPIAWTRATYAGLRVDGGREHDRRAFPFATGATLYDSLTADETLPVELVAVLWLDEFANDTRITAEGFAFGLAELLSAPEWRHGDGERAVTAFLLGHDEIGRVEASSFLEGPAPTDGKYAFAIMADPQGGDPTHERYVGSSTRMHIHNAFVEATIRRVNALAAAPGSAAAPLFTLVLGDYTDHQGEREHFAAMDRLFGALETPVLLAIGNHETRYGAEFGPGYNMAAFDEYFAAQERLTGMRKLLYSFDLGAFHYVVWPDPLRSGFWESHPHYFDWLRRDLAAHRDRPTIFFQHVPVHPIGIDPLVHYAEKPYVKRLLLEALTAHGNVRYVFSGHVHIPIKASVKTAVTYAGINFVNLPAAGYRPRAFGEPDYFGGPCQGAAVVSVDGDAVEVRYVDVTGNVLAYPSRFAEAPLETASLLTFNKWELATAPTLRNGRLDDLEHWHYHYVYREDVVPSYRRAIATPPDDAAGGPALYLRADRRAYDKPGQDRLPQTLNQVTQVLLAPDGRFGELALDMRVDGGAHYGQALVGAFVWVEGYWGHHLRYSLIYSAGKIPATLGNRFDRASDPVRLHRHLPLVPGRWHALRLNPERDLGGAPGRPIDRYAINLGVWNINDGNNGGIGAYFRNLVQGDPGASVSAADGQALTDKPEALQYVPHVDHVAGEHVIARQEELYYF